MFKRETMPGQTFITSRKLREGSYCGRSSAGSGKRTHVRSKTCNGHPPGSASAELEVTCRRIRREQNE